MYDKSYWDRVFLNRLFLGPLRAGLTLYKSRDKMKHISKQLGFKAVWNYGLARTFVKEVGPAVLDPVFTTIPSLAPYPQMVEIEVTTRCHLKCIMCEHTHWDEPNWDLSFEDFKMIIDGFPKLRWCNPTGEGSAFLNKDYMKMLRYLKKRHVYVEFVESFDRLNEDIMKELIDIGIDRIWISVDGATRETYNAIRIGADFDRTVSNIRKMVELKKMSNSPIPELCFRYILMSLNIDDMPKFVELVHSLESDHSIEFVGLLEFDETKYLLPKEDEHLEEVMHITEERARELRVNMWWCHEYHTSIGKRPVTHCSSWTQPYIMMGGYVLPCCAVLMSNKRSFLREHSFGNVLEQSMKEIWYSPRYREFRKSVPKSKGEMPEICKGCRAFDTSFRE